MSTRDKFADAARAFFSDIRQRVVEEAWFGRGVTSEHGRHDSPSIEKQTVTETAVPHRTSITELGKQSLIASDRSFAHQLGWDRSSGREEPNHGIDR